MLKALTNETTVSIGIVIALVAFAWRLSAAVTEIEKNIDFYNKQLTHVLPEIQKASVKHSEMESWLSTLRATNPQITFPSFPSY